MSFLFQESSLSFFNRKVIQDFCRFYDAQEQEFEDDTPHYPIKDVLVPSSQPPRPKVTLKSSECLGHNDAGVFCFNCKGSFDSYNQFQLHLNEDYNDGKCNRALPEYYYVQVSIFCVRILNFKESRNSSYYQKK